MRYLGVFGAILDMFFSDRKMRLILVKENCERLGGLLKLYYSD